MAPRAVEPLQATSRSGLPLGRKPSNTKTVGRLLDFVLVREDMWGCGSDASAPGMRLRGFIDATHEEVSIGSGCGRSEVVPPRGEDTYCRGVPLLGLLHSKRFHDLPH